MFKTDLHVHTSPISACAHASAGQMARRYAENGYSTVVLSNHINLWTFGGIEDAPWEDKVRFFLAGYHAACAAGEDAGVRVLLGMELRFSCYNNDYLVFGASERFLMTMGDVRRLSLEDFARIAHAEGLLIFQAHPFRFGMTIVSPEALDGYEVRNTHLNHDSHNDIAAHWARLMGMPGICGSDHHDPDSNIAGGIVTRERIESNEQLLKTLKEGAYTLL